MSFTENSLDAEGYEGEMREHNRLFDQHFKVYSDMIEKGCLDAEYLQSIMDIDDDLKQALMEVISDRNKD